MSKKNRKSKNRKQAANLAFQESADLTSSEIKLATLQIARADVDYELRRTSAIDSKLQQIAAFSGVSLTISGAIGSNALLQNRIDGEFAVHIGVTLGLAVLFLAVAVWTCFRGLRPADFVGVSKSAAIDRARPSAFEPGSEVVERMISTYYTSELPTARDANAKKVVQLRRAYVIVELGFAALAVSLLVTILAALV